MSPSILPPPQQRVEPPPAPPQPDVLTIWIVEDNDLLRESIAHVINQTPGLCCPLDVATCEEALAALDDGAVPEVILLDIGLPGMSGIDGIAPIHARSPSTQVLMLTVHEDRDNVFEALCAGASGYLLKPASPARIVEAIEDIRRGGSPMSAQIARKVLDMFTRLAVPQKDYGLSQREREVLHLLVDGLTQKRIAEHLFLSEHTINTHIRNIYAKLHVHSRSGAVAKALRERLI